MWCMIAEQYTDDFATYIVDITFLKNRTFLLLLWLLLIQQFLTSQDFWPLETWDTWDTWNNLRYLF